MARGHDHIVHAVHDLDAAAALYRSLGFTVGLRNRHPRVCGTQNHIVQLPGTFIELLAIADESALRRTPRGSFLSAQNYPENFWNPAFQKHANSVTGIAGVVAVAEEPARHLKFVEGFVGASAERSGEEFTIATPRGTLDVVTPAAFLHRVDIRAPEIARGARLAALRFTSADASLLQGLRELTEMAGLYAGNAAVIGPEDALDAVLVFEPAR